MDSQNLKEVSGEKLPISHLVIVDLIIYILLLPSTLAPLAYKILLYVFVIILAVKVLMDVKAKKVRGKILSIIIIIFASINLIFSILIALK